MTPKGRSLDLFFVDGNPDGMLTAEVFNWTGHVLRIPRTQLAEGLKRDAAKQTGVYILLGDSDEGPLAYIGESEDMSERLKDHAKKKDWWNDAVLVTTHGDALHKAHARHLERALVERATETRVRPLENGNLPGGAGLNEAAIANMASFLDTLYMVLPAIRVDLFQSGARAKPSEAKPETRSDAPQEFIFEIPKHRIRATARLEGGELVVQAGSRIRGEATGPSSYRALYDDLLAREVIRATPEGTFFSANYAFASPSAAAAVVAGRSANGRTSWKTPDGLTYAEWEARLLEQDA